MDWVWVVIGLIVFAAFIAIRLSRKSETPNHSNAEPLFPLTADSQIDIDRMREQLAEHERRIRLVKEAGMVSGKHYTEWVRKLDRLRAEKRDDEALTLLFKCIDATEHEAETHNRLFPPTEDDPIGDQNYPAPAYYEWAAIIYRRRKDYVAEIEIIDRWEAKAAGARGLANATGKKLAIRKARAIELMNSR